MCVCIYIYIYTYIYMNVLIFICIHFTTSMFFYVPPWPPKSFTPTQPLALSRFHRSEVRWPSSLLGTLQRVRDAQCREWRKIMKGWPRFKTGASEEQGLQNTAPKVSLVFFVFLRWVIKKVVKLQCHYTHVVSSTFLWLGKSSSVLSV